jgi:DNA-binding transcriptional LysR family regulator
MNWDDTRIFLSLSREKTLRGAARVLGMNQATVGRHITALEQSLGTTLFLRRSDGYELTTAGEAALNVVESMERRANELQRLIQGMDQRLAGEVRVATTDSLALDFLIPAIKRLHADHPEVSVQLHASTQMANLAKREADIAVRTIKPDNPDLITRRLAKWPIGLFAAPEYLKRFGEPVPGAAFDGHDLVLYQPYVDGNQAITLVGEPIHKGRVVVGANSSLMLRTLVREGLGLSEMPVYMGEAEGLVRVWPGRTRAQAYEVWLVTHQDLRHTARTRAMIDCIVQSFGH